MNVSEELLKMLGYDLHFESTRMHLEMYFGACELMLSTDTLQYNNYEKYESEMFDTEAKVKRHAEVFPRTANAPLNWVFVWQPDRGHKERPEE